MNPCSYACWCYMIYIHVQTNVHAIIVKRLLIKLNFPPKRHSSYCQNFGCTCFPCPCMNCCCIKSQENLICINLKGYSRRLVGEFTCIYVHLIIALKYMELKIGLPVCACTAIKVLWQNRIQRWNILNTPGWGIILIILFLSQCTWAFQMHNFL